MHTVLRPLGIGEMLDRAVTLSVRSVVPLALIWVLYIVPQLVLAHFIAGDTSKVFNVMIGAMTKGANADPNALAKQIAEAQGATNAWGWYFGFLILAYPLACAALLRATSDIYLGIGAPRIATAYRDAVGQWLPMLLLSLIWIAFGIVAYLGVVLVGVVVGIAFALLIYLTKVFGIVLAVVAGVIGVLAAIVVGALGLVTFQVSYVTQVIERTGPVRAFAVAFRRVVGHAFKRSVLFALALGAVNIALALVSLFASAFSYGLVRSNALGLALSGVLGLVNAIFLAAMITVFYYDVRIRTEGFDLQVAAQAEAAAEASTAPA